MEGTAELESQDQQEEEAPRSGRHHLGAASWTRAPRLKLTAAASSSSVVFQPVRWSPRAQPSERDTEARSAVLPLARSEMRPLRVELRPD